MPKKKGVKTFEVGDRVRILRDRNGYGFSIGNEVKIIQSHPNKQNYQVDAHPGLWIAAVDLEPCSWTKAELADVFKKYRALAYLAQSKIDYLTEVGKEEFLDEEDFQKHQVKKIIDSENISAEDKAERIAAIFKGE